MAIRQASRHLRPAYHPDLDVAPFRTIQVVDAGDIPCNPFDIDSALNQIHHGAAEYVSDRSKLVTLGGDHTITLGVLRAMAKVHGPMAVVHFDAHLDTWDTYFEQPTTHGTFLRRAFEDGLLTEERSMHLGIRGPIYDRMDLTEDASFGFKTLRAGDLDTVGLDGAADAMRQRVGDLPVYISIDIDVLDPAFAPGTGTPEMGGFTSRELLHLLRRLDGINIIGADVVEVAPAYDHAELTTIAAATVMYDLITLMTKSPV